MPSAWRIVRVFISSTFRDMHAERDRLVKIVFPELREQLLPHCVYLDDIDLRWGVTREQAENNEAVEFCLEQAEQCDMFLGILGERYGWVPTSHPSSALEKFPWIRDHLDKSVTELEFLQGALSSGKERSAAVFFRDSAALGPAIEPIRLREFVESDEHRITKLDDLKRRIRTSQLWVMDGYPARWDPQAYDRPTRSRGRLVDLREFGERVRQRLWEVIWRQLRLSDTPTPGAKSDWLEEESGFQAAFIETHLRVYVGREPINRTLLDFAERDDKFACLVTGPSGSGKSAAMARFVTDHLREHPEALTVPHFVGASARSTSLREMLRRICQVLKDHFDLPDDIPHDVSQLSAVFREVLTKVPGNSRVLLAIDAVNQLDEADGAQSLTWLPTRLPPNVKVVVSCTTGSGKPEPVLEAFGRRKHTSVEIGPLNDREREEIIRRMPSLSAKALDQVQVRLLLENPATANPLFLRICLEELRGLGSFEHLSDRITAFPREGDTVTGVFAQVIERLEEEFDSELVRTTLMLLAASRRGLLERELQGLVSGSATSDNLFPLLRQLRPYLLRRAGLIDFYHRDLYEAVQARWLGSKRETLAAHRRLAEFFHNQATWLPVDPTRQGGPETEGHGVPDFRKVDELPWQRLQAEQWEEAVRLLTDLPFLEAKASAGLAFDLADDVKDLVERLPADFHGLGILRLLGEALRIDINFIDKQPQFLFQCLWNRCWWFDSPQAAVHFEPPEDGWVPKGAPWERVDGRLYTMLERWRIEKENAAPGFHWVQYLRPPPVPLGTAQRFVLHGHEGYVRRVGVSPNGRMIASGSADHNVRLWDADRGHELACLRGHSGPVTDLAFSPDNGRIASSSADRTVRLWEVDGGDQIACLSHEDFVRSVAFSPDGRRIVSGSDDHTAWVWDADTSRLLTRLRGHAASVQCATFSPDGSRIASGSDDKTLRVWNAATGEELACLSGHEKGVKTVAYLPDGRRVVSGSSDRTVRLWDTQSGRQVAWYSAPGDFGGDFALSPDGVSIASGSTDNAARIWDSVTGRQLACLRGHEFWVWGTAFSPDGHNLVTGGQDKTVRVWKLGSEGALGGLREHEGAIWDVRFALDGQSVVSGADDQTLRVWDTASGRQLDSLSGHEDSIQCLDIAPDGKRIVSGSSDRTVRVWDLAAGRPCTCLRGHDRAVEGVAISQSGRRVVSCSLDATIRIWDADNGQELVRLGHDKRDVRCVAFSPDGRRVVGGGYDGTVRIWDISTGEELACLNGHESWIWRVAFSPDGRRIASSGWDDWTVRVWDTETQECIDIIDGVGDVAAIAAGALPFPWRALYRGGNTVIESSAGANMVSVLPIKPYLIVTHPAGRIWAATDNKHLYLLALQGADESRR